MPLLATPYPHVINGINGPTAPKYTYLVFYSSVVDGRMWCPDCVRVESTVKEAFDGEDKPSKFTSDRKAKRLTATEAIIHWVGKKEEWRTPTNEARVHWKVNSVPTILRLEEGKETARLVEDEIMDKQRLQAFIKTE